MDDTLSPIQSLSVDSRAGSRAGKEDETGRRFTNRFRRRKITQTDRDTHRLQQLGYDAVLGRDYNFWSSVSIGWMNIGTIQVSTLRPIRVRVRILISRARSLPWLALTSMVGQR